MDAFRWDPDDEDGRAVNPSDNPTFQSVLARHLTRRALLKGAAAGLAVVLTDKATYEKPGSRFPDNRPDMPPRPSVLVVSRDDGGKVGT